MNRVLLPIVGLLASNVFMTIAWHGHLKALKDRPRLVAARISGLIAFFEDLIQVPANRVGHQVLNFGQLKIVQEVIFLGVFVPFALLDLGESIRWNDLWAGSCLLGAVSFIFRG